MLQDAKLPVILSSVDCFTVIIHSYKACEGKCLWNLTSTQHISPWAKQFILIGIISNDCFELKYFINERDWAITIGSYYKQTTTSSSTNMSYTETGSCKWLLSRIVCGKMSFKYKVPTNVVTSYKFKLSLQAFAHQSVSMMEAPFRRHFFRMLLGINYVAQFNSVRPGFMRIGNRQLT